MCGHHTASTSLLCLGCWHAVPVGCPPVVARITLRYCKILRLTSKRGQENGSLDKILLASAYESRLNSNSQKPKLGSHHGLAVPFDASVAAPCFQAHQCGLRHPGVCRTLCHATSEPNVHGSKKGNISHQPKLRKTILLPAKLSRSLLTECLLPVKCNCSLWF